MKPATLLLVGMLAFSAALFAVSLYAQQRPPTKLEDKFCIDEKMRDQIREMTVTAIDTAFQEHMHTLWATWMKAPSDRQARDRAARGAQLGIAAYVRAHDDALKWIPDQC